MDQGRDPCPYRIVDDVGGAYVMGAGGGAIWHSFRGWRNSPKGERLHGLTTAVKSRAPVLGGNFAVWGLCFASFDCTFAAIRRKEDPWNTIGAGAATGGLLAARMGPKSIVRNALVGGFLLALIEGFGIFMSQKLAPPPPPTFSNSPIERAAPPPVTSVLGGTHYVDSSAHMVDTGASGIDVRAATEDIYRDDRFK